jgi:hypothetical protein
MHAFGIRHRAHLSRHGLHPQFGQAGPQYRSGCHDYGALNEVL